MFCHRIFLGVIGIVGLGIVNLSAVEPDSIFEKWKTTYEKYKTIDVSRIKYSLEMWGDKVPSDIDKIFKVGALLNDKGNFQDSIFVLNHLLKVCSDTNVKLHVDQLHNILLNKAYCYADSNQQKSAIEIYYIMIDLLNKKMGANKAIPGPITVIYDKSKENIDFLLGTTYQDLAISETAINDWSNARIHITNSEKILKSLKAIDKIKAGYKTYSSNAVILKNPVESKFANDKLREYQ